MSISGLSLRHTHTGPSVWRSDVLIFIKREMTSAQQGTVGTSVVWSGHHCGQKGRYIIPSRTVSPKDARTLGHSNLIVLHKAKHFPMKSSQWDHAFRVDVIMVSVGVVGGAGVSIARRTRSVTG